MSKPSILSFFMAAIGSSLACSPPPPSTSDIKFNAGEHMFLGDSGYETACDLSTATCPTNLYSSGLTNSFTYGEIVAFGGDFYETPDELYNLEGDSLFDIFRDEVGSVRDVMYKELEVIERFLHGHIDEEYPDYNLSLAFANPRYLLLALKNTDHFGFYNMAKYIEIHTQALDLAIQGYSYKSKFPDLARHNLNKAIFHNAFADHFLTDGFAAGHIRTPREQIRKWAIDENVTNERGAGLLSKILHDRDGEVRASGLHGMKVTNSQGDYWTTRCDGQLFWNKDLNDPTLKLPIQAVTTSLSEILHAFQTGEMPQDIFAATKIVPYPVGYERPLTEIFSAEVSDELFYQLPRYQQVSLISGVDRDILKQFLTDLPLIMTALRQDVETMIEDDPVLSKRLPRAYLNAYRTMR